MLQQALNGAGSYLDNLLLSYQGCCCSSADPQKGADLVVSSDWDTDERQRHAVGYVGNIHEPTACRAMEPGSPPGRCASPDADGRGASPRAPRAAQSAQTPRAAAGALWPLRQSPPSPLGCGLSDRDPDEGSSDAAVREAMQLRDMMKQFVQEMVHGRRLPVVIGEGRTESCKLTLTPNLLYLQLDAAGVTHDIPLRNVKDVCPGRLTSSRLVPIELDDLCNTLVLRNNECVTFRLGSIKERDEFTKCVKVLALALDQ